MEDNKTIKKQKLGTKWILLISVIVLAGVVIFWVYSQSQTVTQASLEKKLVEMGGDFYENFYYDSVTRDKSEEEIAEFFSGHEELGLRINLDNLGRYNDNQNEAEVSKFVNPDTKVACDLNNSRAVIYPKAPYGKKDYEVKAELDCGFENAGEKTE